MTRETFEKKFAEFCDENGIAFLCRINNYAVNLEDVMIGLSKCVEEDGNISYLRGRNDAIAEMNELCKSGEASDGYHTFNELYDFRREYNAALVNSGVWKAHKSHRHHSGELCFGGGWFIVMIDTPYGQISNHYQDEYWDEFNCEEKEFADEWDGHTENDVLNRLRACNTSHCKKED